MKKGFLYLYGGLGKREANGDKDGASHRALEKRDRDLKRPIHPAKRAMERELPQKIEFKRRSVFSNEEGQKQKTGRRKRKIGRMERKIASKKAKDTVLWRE
ncbi:MAG: hypothetical protein H6727_10425 [Myxococcales bacterium]|nr:hypothetical protein [Myxococcales bacterium]